MAKPTTGSWTKLTFWLGDSASPEDFTSLVCGMTTKSFTITGETSDQRVPDCDDPDLPAWVERVVKALSAGWAASGLLAAEVFEDYRDWMLSAASRNALVVLDIAGAQGYYSGAFVMTSFAHVANLDDGKVQVNLQIQSDGPIVWNAGLPA
jgi:hypothetical protein